MSIYKLWFMRYKDAWFALTEEEQTALSTKVMQALPQVGGKYLLNCTSLWANEKWTGWGVEEYPDIEAVQAHTLTLFNMGWHKYIASWTILGTVYPPEAVVAIEKAPLYKVALFRYKDAWLNLAEAERHEWNEKVSESQAKVGCKSLMGAFSSWSDEQWTAWIVEAYPSLEGVQQHTMWMETSGWYKYVRAISTLGVRWPPE